MSENINKSQLEEAGKLVDDGNYEEAISIYENLVKEDSACAEAWLILGSIYGEMGDFEKATEYVKRAVEIEPDNSSALQAMGQVYSAQGDRDAALEYFSRAVMANSEDCSAHCLLGEEYRVQSKIEEAIHAYEQALLCEGPSDQIWSMLGYLYLQKGDNSKAEEYYRQAIAIDKSDVASVTGWCVAMSDTERSTEADNLLDEYIQNDIADPEINAQLAGLCSKIGRHGEAMEFIQHAIDKAPTESRYLLSKAEILERQGNLPGSFEILKPFLESQPVEVQAVLVLAKFSHIVGLKEQCMQLLQGALADESLAHDVRDQVLIAINWVNDNAVDGHSA